MYLYVSFKHERLATSRLESRYNQKVFLRKILTTAQAYLVCQTVAEKQSCCNRLTATNMLAVLILLYFFGIVKWTVNKL